MGEMVNLDFYKGKRVFVTGHTGFKGSWLCRILVNAGAEVTGYALEPPINPNLWSLLEMDKEVNSIIGDVRDLEALSAYLLIAEHQRNNLEFAGNYNVGSNYSDCVSAQNLAEMFCKVWGNGADYEIHLDANTPHEANFLKLDCSKIQNVLGWKPTLNIEKAVKIAVEWEKARIYEENIVKVTDKQISEYFGGNI